MALIGHLQVANEYRVASATLTAASSGPIPKAPGSAGGYLQRVTRILAERSANGGLLRITTDLRLPEWLLRATK